jgi:ADP-ribose pyrophosphatase YjhB (NUDIX family)
MLCRRAIEPRVGYWTLPAGFMEIGETTEQAAMREAREEANAVIVIDRLLAVYTIPRIAQVQIMYLAHLEDDAFSAGPESLEVILARWDEIPWGDIAFPSVTWALQQYRSVEGLGDFAPFSNPPGEFGNPQAY